MLSDDILKGKVKKKEFKERAHDLRIRLSELSRALRENGIPAIIVFEGWDAAGKGKMINELILGMDARSCSVYSSEQRSEEERMRPLLWSFQVKTPAAGNVAVFDKSWNKELVESCVGGVDRSREELLKRCNALLSFERSLIDNGTLLLKYFLHISKGEQEKRFEKLMSDERTRWRVSKKDERRHKQYDKYKKAFSDMLEQAEAKGADWKVIGAEDLEYAALAVIEDVINEFEAAVEKKKAGNEKVSGLNIKTEKIVPLKNYPKLSEIDPQVDIEKGEYKDKLKKYQKELRGLEHELYLRRVPLIVMYEGWDAAGKGGSIRRLAQSMDPRGYEVIPVSAPDSTERAHHYLWRFWKKIPKAGHIAIFDRTWYGRVLVERVEGFAKEEQWRRAYDEINETEKEFTNFGGVIVKFWLQIDKDEQLRRFKEREETPHKRWKLTEEDWRNREKRGVYEEALAEMFERTHTQHAPWTVVEGNNKHFARIKALKTVIDSLKKVL